MTEFASQVKPLDARLLRHAKAARKVLVLGGLLGFVKALATLGWTWSLAQLLTISVLPHLENLASMQDAAARQALPADALQPLMFAALGFLLVRSLSGWGLELVAARGAIKVKLQLREAALKTLDEGELDRERDRSESQLTLTLGRGLDALDAYFSGYLPQLILTAVATPPLLAGVIWADITSGLTVLIVFPIIPVFMILIGLATQAVQDKQWQQLQRLSRSFLDVLSGLPTLKIFGREARQAERVESETEDYRQRTMRVLRVTFLSGFVLDLAGTFSIALVAVTVGTRLVAGDFSLALGLFVLLLLPEVFIPIRQVGVAFHASTEGLAAAGEAFAVIEGKKLERGDAKKNAVSSAPSLVARDSRKGIFFDGLQLARDGKQVAAPVSFTVAPKEFVALAGPSGVGKSTLLATVMGFANPAAGFARVPETVAWAGQRPGLLRGTLAQNVSLGLDLDIHLVRRALDRVGLHELASERELGVQGAGLSGGQAQRVSIARCLYRAWRLDVAAILCDEPSSALDSDSERIVCAALRQEALAGRAILVVSHRNAVLAAADRVERLVNA